MTAIFIAASWQLGYDWSLDVITNFKTVAKLGSLIARSSKLPPVPAMQPAADPPTTEIVDSGSEPTAINPSDNTVVSHMYPHPYTSTVNLQSSIRVAVVTTCSKRKIVLLTVLVLML